MQVSQYLVIKRTGSRYAQRYSTRVTKSSPSLDSNEIALKINVVLPDTIFDKPLLEAKVVIPEEAVSKPAIEASVIDNVEQIIKQNTGFEVKLEVVDSRGEEEV